MKKIILSVSFIGVFVQINAQNTGINTTNPKATLDIAAKTDASAQVEGILIPRLTGDQIKAMPITNLQESTMVYATSAATNLTLAKDNNLIEKGYFYWDGTAWQNVKGNDWRLTGNAGTIPGVNFIGTNDNKDVVIKRYAVGSGWNRGGGLISGSNQDVSFSAYNGSSVVSNSYANVSFGEFANPSAPFTGDGSVVLGAYPHKSSGNVAIGFKSLSNNSGGSQNTSVGTLSLQNNTNGNFNSSFGEEALTSNVVGNLNTAVGLHALHNNQNGSNNSSVGAKSLVAVEGSNNVAVGTNSGLYLSQGSNNILLGSNVELPAYANNFAYYTASNQLSIGNSIFGLNINDGNGSNDLIGIQTKTPTHTLHVYSTANPVRFEGLQASASSTEQLLVADNSGVLKTTDPAKFINSGFYRANVNSKSGLAVVGYTPSVIGSNAIDASFNSGGSAKGDWSLSLGRGNNVNNDNGVALGSINTVTGSSSVAIGKGNVINMDDGYAFGSTNQVKIMSGVAIGSANISNGWNALAIGNSVNAQNWMETAMGMNNTVDPTPYNWGYTTNGKHLFTIGNGFNSGPSDAFVILRNGQVGIGYDNFRNRYDASIVTDNNDNTQKTRVDINGSLNLAPQSITIGGSCLPGTIAFGTDGNFYGCDNTSTWKKMSYAP